MFFRMITPILFTLSLSGKKIKNIHLPACRNCIHYKPDTNFEFDSTFNKCQHFGEQDLVTGKIAYTYANTCRNDETKCGEKGVYFEKEQNMLGKSLKHRLFYYGPNAALLFIGFIFLVDVYVYYTMVRKFFSLDTIYQPL